MMDPLHYQLQTPPPAKDWKGVFRLITIVTMIVMFLMEAFWFFVWWGFNGLVLGTVLMPSVFIFPLIIWYMEGWSIWATVYTILLIACIGSFAGNSDW